MVVVLLDVGEIAGSGYRFPLKPNLLVAVFFDEFSFMYLLEYL